MTLTFLGHPFETIPRAGCIVREGKRLHLISETDDRMKGDSTSVRRMGLDGWRKIYEKGVRHRPAFYARYDRNCLAASWINIIELHDKANTGQAGPFKVAIERWSNGVHMLAAYYEGKFLHAEPFKPDHDYRFVLTFKYPGWLFFEVGGKKFAEVPGFGKASQQLYPQIRLYSNGFAGRMDAWIWE